MDNSQLLFNQKQEIGTLKLKEIIKIIGLCNKREHLTEEEFSQILTLYSNNRTTNPYKYIWPYMVTYKVTIEKFNNIEDWENALSHEKIPKSKSIGKALYYFCMVLCGRINPDWNILNNSFNSLPEMLSEEEKVYIENTAISIGYNGTTIKHIILFIEKIMICTDKDLKQINENDLYLYRNSYNRPEYAKATFHVLKYMGNIHSSLTYEQNGKENIVCVYRIEVYNKNLQVVKIFNDFLEYIERRFNKSTRENKINATKIFINWLWDNHKEITSLVTLSFDNLFEFANSLKNIISKKTGIPYSKSHGVTILSNLKDFFFFLDKMKLVNEDLHMELTRYNDLYSRNNNSKSRPTPVSKSDRIKIEEAIYAFEYKTNPLIPKMLKLLYLLGMRPFEVLCLKLDCIRGSKEVPKLYIHKSKNDKERYIPLTAETLSIIEELREYNKISLEIYSEIDKLSVQRLFCYQGSLITESTFNTVFENMLVANEIITLNKKAKYTIYILRKIRITTWLESGISPEEVAKLIGQDNVDNHNFYIISKELRMINAKKVYNAYYKELYEQVLDGKPYMYKEETNVEKETQTYLEKLQDIISRIESKDINRASMDTLIKNYPELIIPVPCGKCFAVAVMGDDFECERMKFPCLECTELIDAENNIMYFNDFVVKIYKSRHNHIKKGLIGLVDRDNSLLERLKKFFVIKFKLNQHDIECIFEELEKNAVPKRGRPAIKKSEQK